MANARRLGHDDYAFQIRMRIAELAGSAVPRPAGARVLDRGQLRRRGQDRGDRQDLAAVGTRTKHKKYGAVRCLGDWAMDPNPTEGLGSLVEHQRAELSGEAIVIRHADKFSVEAVAAAAAKLAALGISREQIV